MGICNPGKIASTQWLSISLLLFCIITPGYALNPKSHITQFGHTAWRVQDGIFTGTPRTLAQTKDGYLWIGTTAGLVRFDGVRFSPWSPANGEKLPSKRINSLLGSTDGSLWIGTSVGLSRWQDNRLISYSDLHGVTTAIFEDRDKAVWAAISPSPSNTPLCQISDSAIHCYGTADGISPHRLWPIAKDGEGNFWIGGDELVRWNLKSHRSYEVIGAEHSNASVSSIIPGSDGSLWVGIDTKGPRFGLQRLAGGAWKPFVTPEFNGTTVAVNALLLDRDNALWVGTASNGIYRIYDGAVEHFSNADGLSSDFVYKFLEDAEGTVWAVTAKGIDNFRELKVTTFSTREGLAAEEVDSVFATHDGGIWVGGPSSLEVLRNSRISSVLAELHLSGAATSFLEDRTHRLWIGIDDTLTVYDGRKVQRIARSDGSPMGMVYSMTEDTAGDLWVETRGRLTRIRGLKAVEELRPPQVPSAFRVVADAKGGVWLGLANGDLAHYQNGHAETFHFRHSSDTRVEQLDVNADGSVVGATADGLVGWRNGTLATLTTQNGLPCDIAYASHFDRAENLWIYMQCGLVEIKKDQVQSWWQHPDAAVKYELFDVFDGAQPGRAPFGGVTRDSEGRLWFASGVVLQTVDPEHLLSNSVLPPVQVESIVADRRNYIPQLGLRLPPLTRNLEIDYTALSFVVPQKVYFRYKLEGRDESWQESGTRRQAFYTDLRPGNYRFRVMASNNDGIWNEQGATVAFSVAAAWYQTNLFRLFLLFTAIFIAWLLYQMRVRQIAKAISARFDERLAERTRLARELHDTFLQTLQGSKMVAEVALNGPADPVRMRNAIQRVLEWLDKAIHEGRAALHSLRSSTVMGNDLAEAFQRATEDCRLQGINEVSFVAEGISTEMHPIIRDEIYRIGYEAIRNACQHSEAGRLQVRLSYGADLALRVSDNGKGIEPKIVTLGKDGHYGLQGMRERAQRIGAKLLIESLPTSGTTLELIVPGHVVFQNPRSTWSSRLQKLTAFFRSPDNPA
ncbi:putative signal transduction histidine kinase [Candidatus Koribacter versatilis Ellin345]|uniref:Signal transduction histidine kinase n=1 Tax=Koribacter versatilis (strain Ellin345) TaxID=204669 RepID=Q1IK51_KORVE|nr:putative signal transduction histidine kinase [Candidatus Koribacter versatilis Ellin345]